MTKRIAAPILRRVSVYGCAGKRYPPKGGEACVTAERLEYGASQANDTDISSANAACEQKTDEQDRFGEHDGQCSVSKRGNGDGEEERKKSTYPEVEETL
jgi:hypothetical protein